MFVVLNLNLIFLLIRFVVLLLAWIDGVDCPCAWLHANKSKSDDSSALQSFKGLPTRTRTRSISCAKTEPQISTEIINRILRYPLFQFCEKSDADMSSGGIQEPIWAVGLLRSRTGSPPTEFRSMEKKKPSNDLQGLRKTRWKLPLGHFEAFLAVSVLVSVVWYAATF